MPLDDISITIAGAMSKSPYPRPRLLITDPSPICREGLSAVLGRDGRFEICRYGYNGKSEAELIGSHSPDLLLIDPFRNGVDAVWLVKGLADNFPKTRIVVVAYRPEEVYAERILRAGASGYWMKTSEEKELICCIETVLAGNVYLSPRMTLFAVQRLVAAHRIDSSLVGGLTDRELHVFGRIGAGNGPGQIADDLKLSRKTIETYQDRIKTKLGYQDARELRDGARQWVDSMGV